MGKLTQKQIYILGGAVIVLIILVVVIVLNTRPISQQKVTLTIWGIDNPEVFSNIGKFYTEGYRPNVKIEYKKISEDNFESVIFQAMAAGAGPDILTIGNHSLLKFKDILLPVNPTQLSLAQFQSLFPDVAGEDFILNRQIYALPLYIDTLAMLYNKDLINQAGISEMPTTWQDFQNIIPLLRSLNPSGQIQKAAAAIGGSEKTIDNAVDILNLLMIQNGSKMNEESLNTVIFSRGNAGLQAFNFYLQFANPNFPYFTWNDNQTYSLDSFAAGKTAVIFDYYGKIKDIKKKNPFLKIGVAPMPQPQGAAISTNYANYWGLAVSRQSKNTSWAWDFVAYLAAMPQDSKTYLDAANKPPALRSIIAESFGDPQLNVFAKQALTAKSWRQVDSKQIKTIFNNAIQNVLNGKTDSKSALAQAEAQINQLIPE